MFMFAGACARGAGVAKDEAEAVRWYERAGKLGDARSLTSLGTMHALGRGTAPDVAKAIECYRAAAELGDARAMSNLGALALEGRGLPKDEAVAMGWFVKASERGDGDAMHRLAVIHAARDGGDTVRDACFWATLATARCKGKMLEEATALRDASRAKLDEAARREVDDRVAAWNAARARDDATKEAVAP
jgi:TPR repeat protein